MSNWQPIETAPREERILLWDGKWVSTGAFIEYESIGWLMDCYDTERPTPTHWQPLPSPPEPV